MHSTVLRSILALALIAMLSACDDGTGGDAGSRDAADTAAREDADDVRSDTASDTSTSDTAYSDSRSDVLSDTTATDTAAADTSARDIASDTPAADQTTDGDVDAGISPSDTGIWISRDEVMQLPMSGPAWEQLLADANRTDKGTPNLSDQDQDNNTLILASALVYARTGDEVYRTEVREAIMAAMGTEDGGRTLALGRELAAYVIAADLVGLEPDEDTQFRAWLDGVRTEELDGRTLISTHEDRPNNWGTHAGASRVAAAVYLDDTDDLQRAADVFRGWLGDRATYAQFDYGSDLSWQADPMAPVGINPLGATKNGESIDGAQPEEMRRGCAFQYPPCPTGYAWEALQGAFAMAEMLHRQGYDVWQWEDQALLRAVEYLEGLDERYPSDGWWASGDDEWQLWLINARYDSASYAAELPARTGKNVGYTDWTHAP